MIWLRKAESWDTELAYTLAEHNLIKLGNRWSGFEQDILKMYPDADIAEVKRQLQNRVRQLQTLLES